MKAAHWYGTAFWPNVRNISRLAAVRADAGDRFSRQVCIKVLHEKQRRTVVNLPKRGDYCSGTREKERFGKVRDAFLPLKGSDSGVARRKYYEIRVQVELNNLGCLQKSVLSRGAVAQQHESRSIWKCGIGKPVNSEMDDAIVSQLRCLERGLRCRVPNNRLAFLF